MDKEFCLNDIVVFSDNIRIKARTGLDKLLIICIFKNN
jgi:hypothetical protein